MAFSLCDKVVLPVFPSENGIPVVVAGREWLHDLSSINTLDWESHMDLPGQRQCTRVDVFHCWKKEHDSVNPLSGREKAQEVCI